MSETILQLTEHDRERLGSVLRMLLNRGSLLGLEPGASEFYHWAFQNQEMLREMTSLVGLELKWEHENRLLLAIPNGSDFLLRLKLDATLVLLVLWYEYDTGVRDRSEAPPIRISVRQLNDSLETKFQPLRRHLLAKGRLREILRMAERKNLVRIEGAPSFEETGIVILPTLKAVIPFQGITDWNRNAERYLSAALNDQGKPETGELENQEGTDDTED